MLFIEVLVTA